MKSPFPGMDPYLETRWRDIHTALVPYVRDALVPQLPSDLRSRLEEQVYFETDDDVPRRRIAPDVRVVEHAGSQASPQPRANAGAGVAEPLIIPLSEGATEGYIEIIDSAAGNRVVTVIEVLSPSNKRSRAGRELYQRKQQHLIDAGVNLVEIDLLRAGERVTITPPRDLPTDRRTCYLVSAWRASKPIQVEAYPIALRDRLPKFRVPLRESDSDVLLDLQPLIDRAYEMGRHDDLDYSVDPPPPMDAEDIAWCDDVLREAGLRPPR